MFLLLSSVLAAPAAPLSLDGRHAVDANGERVDWDEVRDLAREQDPDRVQDIEDRFLMQNVLMGVWVAELAGTGALIASDNDGGAMLMGIVSVTHGVSVVAILATGVRGKDRQELVGLANKTLAPEVPQPIPEPEPEPEKEPQPDMVPDLPVGMEGHDLLETPNGLLVSHDQDWLLQDGAWVEAPPSAALLMSPPALPDDRTDPATRFTSAGWVVIGGLTGGSGQIPAPSAVALIHSEGSWRACPASPLAARQHVALAELPDGRIAVLGGERVVEGQGMGDFNPPRAVTDTAILDPTTCTWTEGPPMSRARSGAAALWREDAVLVTGGSSFGELPTTSVEVWTP